MDDRCRTEHTKHVLIVEDCDDHADLTMRAMPRHKGYTVQRVTSIAELKTVTSAHNFDIVLLDLGLPESTGIETLSRVQKLVPQAAIIVVTSDDSDETGQQAVAEGAQDYLPKRELGTVPLDRVLRYAAERQQILNTNAKLAADLHEANLALQHATREAEAAGEARSRFLATMSHEIRTPLAAVLGYADIAAETVSVQSDQFALDAIQTVRRNGDHLLALINDILDLAKIDAGGMTLEAIPMSIGDTLGEVSELLGSQFVEKHVRLKINVHNSVPDRVLCDPVRIRQVLLNLLGNALKFSTCGTVSVDAQSKNTSDGGCTVRIDIADTGIGMNPEQLARIQSCVPFVQADSSHTRRFGGTGLGLSISQSLAELMGGSLSIESEEGSGTTCHFEFATQAMTNHEDMHGSARTPTVTRILEGFEILIVDDSADMRRLLKHRIERSGAIVHESTCGREAIETMSGLKASRIDAILTDMQMPEMDGIATSRHLRHIGVSVPIIMVSADTNHSVRDQCIACGCDGFHAKPIMHDALIDQIHRSILSRAA